MDLNRAPFKVRVWLISVDRIIGAAKGARSLCIQSGIPQRTWTARLPQDAAVRNLQAETVASHVQRLAGN